MVLISECFPSDHQSVNDVRELYRASILSANVRPNDQTEEAIVQDVPVTNERPRDVVDTHDVVDVVAPFEEYPGGIRAFLESSKLHLSSPDDIEVNLKKVQQFVAQMTKSALNASVDMVDATTDFGSYSEIGSNEISDVPTWTVDQRMQRPKYSHSVNKPVPEAMHSAKATLSSRKMKATNNPSNVNGTAHNEETDDKHQPLEKCSMPSLKNSKPGAPRKSKNTSTPRYLDVFTKTNSGRGSREIPTTTKARFGNARFAAKFEQNWAPLTVSVVNIEL